jgi:hypothetical protein
MLKTHGMQAMSCRTLGGVGAKLQMTVPKKKSEQSAELDRKNTNHEK